MLEQGPTNERRNIRQTLFHAINAVFRTLNVKYGDQRKEILSLKNIDAGDCTCLTCQVLMGWIFDSVNMGISLPLHRSEWLKEISDTIPPTGNMAPGPWRAVFDGDQP